MLGKMIVNIELFFIYLINCNSFTFIIYIVLFLWKHHH